MAPTEPRLFPEYALTPTHTERAGARRYWADRQTALPMLADDLPAGTCPVCAGDHDADACPHGIAPTLGIAP